MSLEIDLMDNEVLRDLFLMRQKRGERRGRAKLLRLQLEQQFGKLPKWALKLIDEAGIKLLEDWGLKLLKAKRLGDVLTKPRHARRDLSLRKARNGSK